ncbi:hypothetical protein V6000_003856 [Aspergillus fumigatus]
MKTSTIVLSAVMALCVNPALARVPGRPSTPVPSSHTPSATPSSSSCIPSGTPSVTPSTTPCPSRGPKPTGAFPWRSSTFSHHPSASCIPSGRPPHGGPHSDGPGWDDDHREPPVEEVSDFRPRKFKRM